MVRIGVIIRSIRQNGQEEPTLTPEKGPYPRRGVAKVGVETAREGDSVCHQQGQQRAERRG
jgi:hypothetical protein